MTLRFLTGVAIVAAVATGLVKRYRRQIESAGTALAADAATSPTKIEPVAASPVPASPTTTPTGATPAGAATALN